MTVTQGTSTLPLHNAAPASDDWAVPVRTIGGGAGTGTQTDDAAFTPATGSIQVIGAFADESAPDSVDEGDAGAVRMTLARALHTNPRNAAGTEMVGAQANTASISVTPSTTDILTKVTATFTTNASTASYISGEWISDNGTAGSVTKMQFAVPRSAGTVRRVRIRKSDQTVATPTIRLWLWDTTFTVAVGDDAAGAQPLQDSVGFVDVAVVNAGTDDAVGWTNCDIPVAAATLFGLLQSQSTFTGADAEVFSVEIWISPGI